MRCTHFHGSQPCLPNVQSYVENGTKVTQSSAILKAKTSISITMFDVKIGQGMLVGLNRAAILHHQEMLYVSTHPAARLKI